MLINVEIFGLTKKWKTNEFDTPECATWAIIINARLTI